MFTMRQRITLAYEAAPTADGYLNLGEDKCVLRYCAMKALGKCIEQAARRADSMARLELSLSTSSAARPAE